MKALLVNSQHPETPHIGAVRAARFAAGLAQRGHKVILLTPVLRPEHRPTWPNLSRDALHAHNWAEPMLLTHPMNTGDVEARERSRLPSVARRALTATALVLGDGTAAERVAASRPTWRPLVSQFCPDIIWTTFGDTSNLKVAQSIARLADTPWIMDIKDNWEAFLPRSLRRIVAWRFRDAAGITSNAEYHARVAARWHRGKITTIYSGVAPEMVASAACRSSERFRITLVGSTRGLPNLVPFLSKMQRWIDSRTSDEQARIEFCYAGGSVEEVRTAVSRAGLTCRIDIQSYLTLTELGRFCQDAAINCYLWDPTTFHHKLLELLACGRHVVSFPGEHEESIELAQRVGGSLSPCADAVQLGAALDHAWRSWSGDSQHLASSDVTAFSWDTMTARLEELMLETICERALPRSHAAQVERRARGRVEFF